MKPALLKRLTLTISSFAISAAAVHASQNLELSISKLEKGYAQKQLTLKDGRRFTVENLCSYAEPSFYVVYDKKMKLFSWPSYDGNYSFYHTEGGGPEYRYNEATGEWEYDYDNIMPGMEVLNLILKPLKEVEPSVLPVIEEKKDEILPVQSSLVPSTSISLKEDLPVQIVPSYKIVKLPDIIKNKDSKGFYVCHDAERNVWVGLEYLSNESASWWRQRLSLDALMQFDSQIKEDEYFRSQIPMEEQLRMEESNRQFTEAMSSVFGVPISSNSGPFSEAREFIHLAADLYPCSSDFFGLLQEQRPNACLNDSYLSAWRGFRYNLDHAQSVPTYVAYVSSQPVEGPLYQSMDVSSSAVKMAMTVTHGGCFYSPLGIYRSPIAQAFDQKHGLKFGNVSKLLHISVADFMGQIESDQEIKYGTVRPLKHMKKLLEEMGVSMSSSYGAKNTDTAPIILHTYYDENKGIDFGGHPFALFDPRSSEVYQIGGQHWFAKSSFLGGVDNWRLVREFPFMTFDRQELANLKK